jgi:hypothetical protein
MADGEDRPIVVSGGEHMVTVRFPSSATQDSGSHTVKALPATGPFKTIVFMNAGKVEFSTAASEDWQITIE